MDKYSMIKKMTMTAAVAFISISAFAQDTVKGFIINATTGAKLVGAHITVCGSQNVAMSDEEGTFELKDADKHGVLEIEATGCEMQIVPLRGRKKINIRLVPKSTASSFYDKISLSSKIANTATATPNASTNPSDVINMLLNGSVNNRTHSGTDAGGAATFIRGMHTLNMTAQPLFIVDGIQWQSQDGISSLHDGYFSNPLALIAPDDIENIQVLKNGTAIYGAKAANGVIIINTKRSHNMATEIDVNLSAGIKSPFKTIPMMNAGEYRTYASDVMSGMKNINNITNSLHFLDDDATSSFYNATHNNTDWLDNINKSSFVQNYGVSVRGGDDVALYSFSLGYSRNDGNIDNTDYDRLNVRFNSDINLTKHLTTRADISFSQVGRDIFDDGINGNTSPLYLSYIKSPLYNPYQFDAAGNLYSRISDKDELGTGNPMAITENAEGKTKNYRFTANLQPTYKFTDRFSLSGAVDFSWDKIKENSFTPDFGLAEVQLYNEQGNWYGEGDNSVASLMTRQSTITLKANADWNVVRGDNDLMLHGGYRYMNNTFESDYGMGYNTGSDNLKSLSITNPALRTIDGIDNNWRTMAWYAIADYNYQNRYFLNASASLESNSRFGRNADSAIKMCGITWGLFPSINAAWVVSNEKFMNSISFIDYLKLHAGYEITGNDDIPNNATRTYFNTVSYVGLAKGLALANVGNDKLKWEKTATFNAGVDMNILDNHASISADIYFSNTTDLLVQKQLGEEFGMKNYWANDGRMTNVGFDISLKTRIIDRKIWKINAGVMLGHYKNEIKSLGSGAFENSLFGAKVLTTAGQPLGVFYGYKTLGVFSTQAEADAANLCVISETGKRIEFRAGDMHFKDFDNNGIINEADREIIGDPNPDIYGNFNINLQYKNFSLETFFTYSLGNDAYNALRASLENGSSLNNQTKNMLNRWTADGQVTSVPRATYGDPLSNSRFSNRWIEDASFLKLRQVSLTYTLPRVPQFLQGASVWMAVNNVFTITKYLGSDPEFSYGSSPLYQGIDGGLTPSTRSYNIGIKLNL